ncbi:hypothetical protein J2X50_004484 [Aminobacter sp. BE322]
MLADRGQPLWSRILSPGISGMKLLALKAIAKISSPAA